MSQTQLDSQECGLPNFNKDADVLVISPEMSVGEGVTTIVVKGIKKPAIVKTTGSFSNTDTTDTVTNGWSYPCNEDYSQFY